MFSQTPKVAVDGQNLYTGGLFYSSVGAALPNAWLYVVGRTLIITCRRERMDSMCMFHIASLHITSHHIRPDVQKAAALLLAPLFSGLLSLSL